jgi:hypothetical protein
MFVLMLLQPRYGSELKKILSALRGAETEIEERALRL